MLQAKGMYLRSCAVALLHVYIVALSLLPPSHHHHTVERSNCYVKPNKNVSCPYPCYTLQQYAENRGGEECHPGTSNTTYVFLGGVHELPPSVSLNFTGSESISLVGNWSESARVFSHAEILCHDQSGFLFKNCLNVDIRHLTFTACGQCSELSEALQATLAFYDTTDLNIDNIIVRNSTGYGMYAQCTMGNVRVFNSVFKSNKGTATYDGGNAGFLYKNCTDSHSLLEIKHSHFLDGYGTHINPLATGLNIFVWSEGVNVIIDNVTAIGNVAENKSVGGNVALLLRNLTDIISNEIVVKNSYIGSGTAYWGAGMFISIEDTVPYYYNETRDRSNITNSSIIPEVVTVIDTHFVNNTAQWEGGGLYSITHEDPGIFSPIASITVRGCTFYNNSLRNTGGGGVAIHVTNHFVLNNVIHGGPQFYTSFIDCTIQKNYCLLLRDDGHGVANTGSSAVMITINPTGVLLKDSKIINNNCSGITAVWSSVAFAGHIEISQNVGSNGGGIVLCDGSYLLLKANTTLVLQENMARNAGGGIYAEDLCLQSEPPCFFQPDIEILSDPWLNDSIHVHLINNKAHYAGSAIYGGSIDICMVFPQVSPVKWTWRGKNMFHSVFHITSDPSDLSPISSDPYMVCFCDETLTQPDCHTRSIERALYPGERFGFHALTVGQFNGSAPQTILATLLYGGKNNESQLGELEESQFSHSQCSKFDYTINSNLSREAILLEVQHNNRANRPSWAQVNIRLKSCPVGFHLTTHPPHKCDCVQSLQSHGVICYIQNKIIHKFSPLNWIGQVNVTSHNISDHVMIFHKFCPYDFCNKIVNIPTGQRLNGDVQCAYYRTGVLCGGCKQGYSVILGNSECRRCTDTSLLLVFVFIIAGLLLVLFLIVTNISVSSGLTGGLIFYANIVQLNRQVFFGESISLASVKLCSVFIAWLNLDFGIDTCFYDGMDAYAKTWLQFVFPLYVWGIAGVIIRLSRRFPSIAGRNPVRVLATLFLLSYAKLLRTIIIALAPAQLDIQGTSRLVWREDGNVEYLRGKHIPLFVVAFSFGLVTLPYAIVLFLLQWLKKHSHRRVCWWVVRMKPLFDAYTGPYKTNCQFWTGSLLLIRIVLFLSFAFPHADPNVRLSLILAACVIVQMTAWSFHGLFQSTYTDVMNSVFLLNLGLLSAVTNYFNFHPGHSNYHSGLILVSVGTAWFMFMLDLIHHGFRKVRKTETWSRFEYHLKGICCQRKMRRGAAGTDGNGDGDGARSGVTQSLVDPFNIQYREPLVSPNGSTYGSIISVTDNL